MARKRLPDTRKSLTHKFEVSGFDEHGQPCVHDGYLTVGLYEDGTPGELFIRFARLGGREGALLDAWATMISIALQSGVPLMTITEKFKHWRFEPQGMTNNSEIPICSSPLDYICRWLEMQFDNEETNE